MKNTTIAFCFVGLAVSGLALAADARYVRSEAGGEATVKDYSTNLEWMQDTGLPSTRGWQAALQYCDDLEFAGQTDWRLPNVTELASIIDEKQPANQPPINQAYFVDFTEGAYWSSTSKASDPPDMGYVVRFDDTADTFARGGIGMIPKNGAAMVMCVRDFP